MYLTLITQIEDFFDNELTVQHNTKQSHTQYPQSMDYKE